MYAGGAGLPPNGRGGYPSRAGSGGLLAGTGLASRARQAAPPATSRAQQAYDGSHAEMARRQLASASPGQSLQFREPLRIGSRAFMSADIVRDLRSASGAKMLRLHPGGSLYICKFDNLSQEIAIMSALQHMNQLWTQHGVSVQRMPVQTVTYAILPLGRDAGFVEVVHGSQTLRELSAQCSQGERHLRVLRALGGDPGRIMRLAASTVAYITACYVLGIRDGHDDNIMLRSDGSLFRVDFGFAFGARPMLDAPETFVPHAVVVALGDFLWREVIMACARALQALSANGSPPGWECCRAVPELVPHRREAWAYAQKLNFEDFGRKVRVADDWSFWRAAKNTLREAVQYAMHEEEVREDPQPARAPSSRPIWY